MVTNQWSLIIYTLLIQAAVGAYIMSYVINKRLTNQIEAEQALKLTINVQYIAGIIAIIGMIASLFHLGSPFKAPNSVLKLGTSWLSREILLMIIFVVLLFVTAFLANRSRKMSSALVVITSLVGLADIYCMSSIYNATFIPAWQGVHTFIVFYAACFILGSLVAIGSLAFFLGKEKMNTQNSLYSSILAPTSLIILAAIAIQIIIVPSYLVSLAASNGAGQASTQLLSEQYGLVMAIRWLLTLCGGLLLIFAAWKQLQGSQPIIRQQGFGEAAAASEGAAVQTSPAGLIYLTLAIMVVGEVIGRYLFYASGVQTTIGMF
ncbi:MAG TPA: dimethyl sulfoxide reductase anchor subunit [Peptococcaceae bacterium]|nr:dimethyl sulfoxide reductase anchor subunit [Peptococcaceae bacterium]